MTAGKTVALTRRTFVGKVMSLLLNMLSRLVITFLPRSKHILILSCIYQNISWVIQLIKDLWNSGQFKKFNYLTKFCGFSSVQSLSRVRLFANPWTVAHQAPLFSVHRDSPGKNTGVGCHALLQGIFPTQGSNPGLLHCRWFFPSWATREAQELFWVYTPLNWQLGLKPSCS